MEKIDELRLDDGVLPIYGLTKEEYIKAVPHIIITSNRKNCSYALIQTYHMEGI